MAKFDKKECASICFLTLAVFIIAVMVYYSDTSVYGDVIYSETDEWSKKGVVDIITTADGVCPAQYEVMQGLFFGTETICKDPLTYTYGSCTSKKERSIL